MASNDRPANQGVALSQKELHETAVLANERSTTAIRQPVNEPAQRRLSVKVARLRVMRTFLLMLAATFLLCFEASAQTGSARFIPVYGPIANPKYQPLAKFMQERRMVEAIAASLSNEIRLPTNVGLVLFECRQENAFYDPGKKAIYICVELASRLAQDIPKKFGHIAPRHEIGVMIAGALTFIVLHEVGHALIDLYDVPVLGREEDAADQISAFLVLKTKDAPKAIAASAWFFSRNGTRFTQRHLADEHSLGPQRKYNLFCWAYGSDPHRYEYLVKGGALPADRARRCPKEFDDLKNAVTKLIGSNLRLAADRSSPPAAGGSLASNSLSAREFSFSEFPVSIDTSQPVRLPRVVPTDPFMQRINAARENAEHQGVNFAGRYVIVMTSCGTSCRGYQLFDGFSGSQYRLPFGGEQHSKGGDSFTTYLEHRPDSKLLRVIFNVYTTKHTRLCRQQFLVWEDERLTPVSKITPVKHDFCGPV